MKGSYRCRIRRVGFYSWLSHWLPRKPRRVTSSLCTFVPIPSICLSSLFLLHTWGKDSLLLCVYILPGCPHKVTNRTESRRKLMERKIKINAYFTDIETISLLNHPFNKVFHVNTIMLWFNSHGYIWTSHAPSEIMPYCITPVLQSNFLLTLQDSLCHPRQVFNAYTSTFSTVHQNHTLQQPLLWQVCRQDNPPSIQLWYSH